MAPVIVPPFPLPEASAVVVPFPSLNPHAPTKPEFGGGGGGGGWGKTMVTILATEGPPHHVQEAFYGEAERLGVLSGGIAEQARVVGGMSGPTKAVSVRSWARVR